MKSKGSVETPAEVRVLRTLQELEEIRADWESWPGHRESELDPFLTFLRSNPRTVRPHVVAAYRAGSLEAILVGRMDFGQISCRLGYLEMNLPARILCFVYGALRGNPSKENCDAIVSSILQSLSAGHADVAYMNFLREDSELCRLAWKKPGALSRDYIHVPHQHYAAALPGSVEEFYQGLSPGSRWQARSKQKKLLKDFRGDVGIRCFRDVTELDEMFQDVEQVARNSYQRGLGVGFFDTPSVRNHLRLRAERGRLRAYVLYLGGKPCAFWIGDINQGTFGSDCLAYDAAFGKHSPGMYLVTKVIEGFCDGHREGVTAVDFALGHAQYKEVLSNQKWRETAVYIFAPTFKGIGLNLARTLISWTDQTIKKVLARTNLLQRIKKAWRDRAKPKEAAHAAA
jgi:hypothetical protein